MNQPLSADALRAALGGVKSDPSPMIKVPQADPDLVSSTLAAYRKTAEVDAAAAATGRPNFRKVEAAAAATPVRANKFAGTCTVCSTRVAEGAGSLDKVDGKWVTAHLPGQCPQESSYEAQAVAAQEVEVPAGFVKITAITGQTYVGLQPGVYTLSVGADGHRTFRVRVQGTEDDFAPGKTILEYLSGPDNDRDYTGFGFLNGTRLAVWKKHQGNEALLADAKDFLVDPSQALLAAKCIRCNRNLTTPDSITAMMGPDCRGKGW